MTQVLPSVRDLKLFLKPRPVAAMFLSFVIPLAYCTKADPPRDAKRILDVDTTQIVQLSAALDHDTIRSRDSGPVYVTMALKAGPGPIIADVNSRRFFALLLNLDGSVAEADSGAASVLRSRWETFAPISTFGAYIERRDLRCVRASMFDPLPHGRDNGQCIALFSLRKPGRYLVAAFYFATPDSGERFLQDLTVSPCPRVPPAHRSRPSAKSPDDVYPCYVNERTLSDTIPLTIVPQ